MSALARQPKGLLPQGGAYQPARKHALVRAPRKGGRRSRSRQPRQGRSGLPNCSKATSHADTRPLGGARWAN
eukprot:13509196-Alexandrium_andersonii.AAC.1